MPSISYGGKVWTPAASGYRNGNESLHRRMWADHYGPIPKGHYVWLADGDARNVTPGNLRCGPRSACPSWAAGVAAGLVKTHAKLRAWLATEAGRRHSSERGVQLAAHWAKRKATRRGRCQWCRGPIMSRHVLDPLYCGPTCAYAAQHARRGKPHAHRCAWCDAEFVSVKATATYCGCRCKNLAMWTRRKAKGLKVGA